VKRFLALSTLGLLALPFAARSQTMELSRRRPVGEVAPPNEPRGGVQFKHLHVKVAVEDQVSTTEVDQTFHNPNDWIAEGTYLFPLPEGTSISNFTMFMGGQQVKGEVLDSDKARAIYQAIVRQRQDPGLLEFVGHRLIRASVFPIPARGDVRITLKFTRVLAADAGWFDYEYPLSSAGARIGEVGFDLSLKSQTPIKVVTSPSHAIAVDRKSDREVHVRYEKKGLDAERSFNLSYSTSEKDLGLHVLAHRKTGDDGTFMLAIAPKLEVRPEEIQPRHIAFVVDTSGSMSGPKMEQAKAAITYCVSRLTERDRFSVIRFSTEVEPLDPKGLIAADAAGKKRALDFIAGFEAAGGTNIDESLAAALEQLKRADGLVEVVFMTDGKPTIGERDANRILANVAKLNSAKARIFCLGVGSDLNTHLLDGISDAHRGQRAYVADDESIEVKVSRFYDKIASPVLTDLALDFGGLETKSLFPHQLPDLFRGGQLLVFGRYKGEGGARAITLTGKLDGKEQKFVFETTFPAEDARHDYLPRLWAQRKVGHLLDQIRLHGESDELKTEVIALASKHGIVTPYTSALVLEDDAQQHAQIRDRLAAGEGAGAGGAFGGRRLREVPPSGDPGVEAPRQDQAAGKSDGDGKRPSDAPAPPASGVAPAPKPGDLREASGDKAVETSNELKKMKELESLEEATRRKDGGEQQAIKQVGDRAFYLDVDGCWIESSLKGADAQEKVKAATVVKTFSDEYFALLEKEPELGRYLKLGKKLVVEIKGTVYRFDE